MPAPLLRTKLYLPPLRTRHLARPQLVDRLDPDNTQLTLISATAGSGKTTLLSEWIAQSQQPVAWLSLDSSDNDLNRFLTYLIAAVQTVQPDFGSTILAALGSPQSPPAESLLTGLVNELADLTNPLTLILDDYHVVQERQVHDAVAFFLEHQPPTIHLILSGRSDPPLPLARLRVLGQMIELRDHDLRFDSAEAAAFIKQVVELELSDGQIAALEQRTEGWIAGLQMAALSLQGRERTQIPAFIEAFTGSHRYVLDYLCEEVLDQQPVEIQQFMLSTSILSRLNRALCDKVTGQTDSQSVLALLETAHLFVVPLDDQRCWYRYHHLFADLLRNRLYQDQPDRVAILHQRASTWFQAEKLIIEAVEHALEAGDDETAAGLIEENTFTMIDQGELGTVFGWLEALPEALLHSRPKLAVSHAWVLSYAGQMEAAEERLRQAERSSDPELQGIIAAIRAYLQASSGEIAPATVNAQLALERLPEQNSMLRAFTAAILSSLHRFDGDFEAAREASTEAIAISRSAGDKPMTVLASCNLAGTLIIQGQLIKAAKVLQEARSIAGAAAGPGGRTLPFAGLASAGLANVLRQWNELEEAEQLARDGVQQSETWGQAEVLMQSCIELAHVLCTRGDLTEAERVLEKAAECAPDLAPWTIVPLQSAQAQLALAAGAAPDPVQWAQDCHLQIKCSIDFQQMFNYLTLAQLYLAQDLATDALQLLERLYDRSKAAGANGYLLDILVLQALSYQSLDLHDRALQRLVQALTLGEPENYRRVFADQGRPMANLLRRAVTRGHSTAYGKSLLALIDRDSLQATGGHNPLLIEALSERELEILRLVAAGLSNRQIAAELVLALGTVKKHISNIYGKLQVGRRTEAVVRARQLDLL